MKKNRIILLILILAFLNSCGVKKNPIDEEENYINNYGKKIVEKKIPKKFDKDLIPDEKTAIKIAEAIWSSSYEYVKDEKRLPYIVVLEENKIWYVKTSLPKGYFGQVLNIKINKYDGKILYVWSEM